MDTSPNRTEVSANTEQGAKSMYAGTLDPLLLLRHVAAPRLSGTPLPAARTEASTIVAGSL